MNKETEYPVMGLNCPANEAHKGQRDRILAAFSDNAIYLHCLEHDWLRVELYQNGKKIQFKGVSAVAEQVKPKVAGKDGKPMVFFDNLNTIPVHGRGDFNLKKCKKGRRMS